MKTHYSRLNETGSPERFSAYEFKALQRIIEVVQAQLLQIRHEHPLGLMMAEILEKTEIVLLNLRQENSRVLTHEYLLDYQKGVWQQIIVLDQATGNIGDHTLLEEQKRILYYLFKSSNRISGQSSKPEKADLVPA
ncbi:MAG: hypothetical protein R3281_10960 [Balneolaceae bacterium]|nr:hypothetical protein [Balneolaceae bacterium]